MDSKIPNVKCLIEIFTMSEKKLLLLDSFLKPTTRLSVKIFSQMFT